MLSMSVTRLFRSVVALVAAAFLSLMANGYARAQNTFGSLSNFDVFNDTGQETHGFEIELDGIASTDVSFTFGAPYQRYGNPTVVNFNNGVTSGAIVRYLSPYDAINKKFTEATPMAPSPITPTGGHACWTGGVPPQGGLPYLSAGCEHFGLGLSKTPTATAYHWLIADPANAGQTIQSPTKVTVPAPVAVVLPPVVPGGQPVVQQAVPAEPPEAQEFGDAQWVKVFMTEAPDPVELNHLVTDDPAVPGVAEVETEWSLLQLDKNAGGGARKEQRNSRDLGVGKQAVVRRYEFYKYTGTYDPETHEAKPTVNDSSPQPNEIGDYEGAQMAAVNIGVPGPTATATATATQVPTPTPTPLPGQLKASPATINFGNAVYGGLNGLGQIVTKLGGITNNSKTLAAPIDPSATDDFKIIDGGSKGCTSQLAAKAKCNVGLQFQPTDFGPRTGKLLIGGVQVATLKGNGARGKIAVPGSMNFGKVKVGTPAPKTLTITNKSPVPIEISDLEIVGDTSEFAVDNNCSAKALLATCSANVTFTPVSKGRKAAKLKITHEATRGTSMINLVGIGS